MESKARKLLFVLVAAPLVSAPFAEADDMLKVDGSAAASHHDVVYRSPAREGWEGLPIGNGRLGAQVWQPGGLLFQLNTPLSGPYGGAIARLLFGTEPGMLEDMEAYTQRLSLSTATLLTEIDGERGRIHVASLVPADADGLILEVDDRRAGDVARFVELEAWRETASRIAEDDVLVISDVLSVSDGSQGGRLSDRGLADYRYALAVGIEGADSRARKADEHTVRLDIDGKRFAVHAALCATREEEIDVVAVARERLEASIRRRAAATRSDHEQWWRDFWSRSFIQLDSDDGAADYLANLWYMHLYAMGIGSRGEVPPKFNGGLWLDDRDFREWGPSYWHWNTQELYWPVYAANHVELAKPYHDTYYGMLPHIEEQTKAFFTIDGAHYPEVLIFDGTDDSGKGEAGVMGIHERLPVPAGGSFTNMILSTSVEVAMQFWWGYLYSGDREFLEQKAYPLMKSCARFLVGYLSRDEAGRYYIYPSNAQENYWMVKNPASDLAAIRYLLDALIDASHALGTDAELRPEWQEVLDHLAPYHIDEETGGIAQYEPIPGQEVELRNAQNPEVYGVGVVPLITLGSPDYELAVRTFRARSNVVTYGWSTDGICAARLGLAEDGRHGVEYLLPALVASHQNHPSGLMDYYGRQPAIHPYLEASGTHATAVAEMLLQSWPQGPQNEPVVRTCPALPQAWSARFKLLGMGGFVVTGAADRGRPTWVSILSQLGGRTLVANPFGEETVVTADGEVILRSDAELIGLDTEPGRTYVLTPASTPRPLLEPFSTGRNETPKRLGRTWIGKCDTVSIEFTSPRCADLTVSLPGWTTPAVRLLLPEWISAANADLNLGTALHTVPGDWQRDEHGAWTGVQTHPGVAEIRTRVEPREYYVDLAVTVCNLSTGTYEELRADFCANVNAGGGSWANREFLVKSRWDRAEDGQYWHEQVAPTGAYVRAGGEWNQFFEREENPDPLDAGLIAVTNEAGNATVFMMWDAPALEPWINDANACMHLRPLVSPALGPGESATIRGRVGVTRGGRRDVWELYSGLADPGR